MVADFSISNNMHSSGQRNQETLRRLAKEIFEKAETKERNVESVIPYKTEYTTSSYIPAEMYIYNISARAIDNNIKLESTLKFLNNKAAIKSFSKETTQEDNADDDLFEITLDESKNIFAA